MLNIDFSPDTNHPDFDGIADRVRERINRAEHEQIVIYESDFRDDELVISETKLKLLRRYAPAPWTGDRPFVYVWRVAVDDRGRWIACSTMIVHVDPFGWYGTKFRPQGFLR